MPEPTNWTSFSTANDSDLNDTEDNDTALDLNKPKGSVNVRSSNPVLTFLENDPPI